MYLKNEHFKNIMTREFGDYFHNSKRLSSKAMLFSSGENLAIIYINTIVFKKIKNTITLNSDGWHTMTTKKHINTGFDMVGKKAFVFQKNYEWYINDNGTIKDYQDNITLEV